MADIETLKYKLIIITGNAGDGKTAFIHQVENRGTDKESFETRNGSRFTIEVSVLRATMMARRMKMQCRTQRSFHSSSNHLKA